MTNRYAAWIISMAIGVGVVPVLAVADAATTARGFGHVHAILVHPDKEALLVGTHHGLFRSHDMGATWERVAPRGEVPGSDFMTLAMHPQQYAQIFAGGHDLGILRSEDFGLLTRKTITALISDLSKPQTLYASSADGVSKSDDAGDSWQRMSSGLSDTNIAALALHPTRPSRLYAVTVDGIVFRSADGTTTWKQQGQLPSE